MIGPFAQLLFLFAAAHVVCDYSLQPEALSAAKRPGGNPILPWPLALGGHALIHGGGVAAVLILAGYPDLWWLGAIETLLHAGIDGAKARGAFGVVIDQALHVMCKALWALSAVSLAVAL